MKRTGGPRPPSSEAMAEVDEVRASVSGVSGTWGSSSGFARLKNVPDSEVLNSVQMGVQYSVEALELEPERDLLIQDFMTFQSWTFPAKGSGSAPPHTFVSFKFLNYAPIAFKCFRGLFEIKTENFLSSMCSESLRQLENPGASGSIFYLTYDDVFIIKTVQDRESDFLLKLLPGYYLNLTQNPKTLLPKFFGFYCYKNLNKNVRLIVMNNLIPSNVPIDQKYDLKGSTSKRKATQAELKKALPTFKDLDFLEHHPDGLILDFESYGSLKHSLERDCRVLESFKIIDYSLLLAVHRVNKSNSFNCYSDGKKEPNLGIPARTTSGEELLLFIGIIDILQSYKFRKKVEHTFKSIIHEKNSISVHRPDFYSQRFQNFLLKTVFKPAVKRKPISQRPSLESEPTCSDSKIQEDTLSLTWACQKAKFTRKKVLSENLREMSMMPSRSKDNVPEGEGSREEEEEEEEEAAAAEGRAELKPANVVALEIN